MSIIVNRNIVFLDSNQFYKGKLEDHASNLNNEDFKHLLSDFPIDQLELLKGKDAYLYDWVDSFEKFNYQELPPKQCFYSSINDGKRDNNNGHISNEKYYNLDPCHYFSASGLSWNAVVKMTKVGLEKMSTPEIKKNQKKVIVKQIMKIVLFMIKKNQKIIIIILISVIYMEVQ